jgi:SAM-dependent methyltransferase
MSERLPILRMKDGLEVVPCALCGSTRAARLYRKFGYGIVRCRRCGLGYANPRLPAERTNERYDAQYFEKEYLPSVMPPEGPGDRYHLEHRYRTAIAVMARSGTERGRVLEIGPGAGFFLKAAEMAGWEAHGLELSTAAAAYARDTLGLDVREIAAEHSPFPAGYFDAVAMFEVVEHLRDPLLVLRAARRALREGGILLLSTPNLDALSRWMLGKQWAVLSPAEHLYYFTETTLARALEIAGFREVTFIHEWEPWLAFETTNPHYTHAPASLRARLYKKLVLRYGPHYHRNVQRRGLADGLMCTARA